MLWKLAAKLPGSTEFVSMCELRQVILKWESEDHGQGAMWGELDVEEMFPNICRDEVGTAVHGFFASVTQASNIPLREAFFRIHRGGIKGMDGIARRKKDGGFHFIPIGD